MEFIISAIVSWVTNNILNRVFFRARKPEKIIDTYERKLEVLKLLPKLILCLTMGLRSICHRQLVAYPLR